METGVDSFAALAGSVAQRPLARFPVTKAIILLNSAVLTVVDRRRRGALSSAEYGGGGAGGCGGPCGGGGNGGGGGGGVCLHRGVAGPPTAECLAQTPTLADCRRLKDEATVLDDIARNTAFPATCVTDLKWAKAGTYSPGA
jgi:hypothetical protein